MCPSMLKKWHMLLALVNLLKFQLQGFVEILRFLSILTYMLVKMSMAQ
jgi:hypothetical protein